MIKLREVVLAGDASNTDANNTDAWYSDETPAKNAREKYLDQNGAQEIVTQFMAYCDSLVGGT